MIRRISLYYLVDFARPQGAKDKQPRKQRNGNLKTVAAATLPAIGIYAGIPDKLLAKGSVHLLTQDLLQNGRISDSEISRLSKKYNVPVRYGKRSAVIGKAIVLHPKLSSVDTFYHELGHIQDKKIIKSVTGTKRTLGLKSSLATLRNEAVANINAIKTRGLKHLGSSTRHAAGSYAGHLSAIVKRHKTGLGNLALAGGVAKTIIDQRNKNKNKPQV